METLFAWIESSSLSDWVQSGDWHWPILEILHFAGLTVLLGAMLIVDLRLMGWFRRIDIRSIHGLLPWAILGFAINLVSGLLFFITDPFRYADNPGFRLKMLLILIAGLNALWFHFKIRPAMLSWGPNEAAPRLAKFIGGCSLGVWFAVLLLGRLLPYTGSD